MRSKTTLSAFNFCADGSQSVVACSNVPSCEIDLTNYTFLVFTVNKGDLKLKETGSEQTLGYLNASLKRIS